MSQPPLSDELAQEAVAAWLASGKKKRAAATLLGIPRSTLRSRLKVASGRGMLLDLPPGAMPGFAITSVSTKEDASGEVVNRFVTQKQGADRAPFVLPPHHTIKGVSALLDADGNVSNQWVKTHADAALREAAQAAILEGMKDEIPRALPTEFTPQHTLSELATQYGVIDAHLGMLAWHEEGGDDYDLKIAEKLIRDFFAQGVALTPASDTAILLNLGDFMHYDSLESVTPENRHVLDSDSRVPKMVRTAIRIIRWSIDLLLTKHANVHIIMADANHDPLSEIWLREMLAMHYENEPRVTVDTSPSPYYCFEWGETVLFYHHGHKRSLKNVDSVFVRDFRSQYGKAKYAYGHLGHLHKNALGDSELIQLEQHETLAAKDAYAHRGGWRSNRSAKVITYHKKFGEVHRTTLRPEMLTKDKAE